MSFLAQVKSFIHLIYSLICFNKRTLAILQVFNVCHGLTITTQVVDLSSLEIDDVGDSREERVFRMWINSLNLENLYINDLFNDLMDGVALLKIMDHLQRGES